MARKTKPPLDLAAVEDLLARGRAAIGKLICDPEVDEKYKLLLMRKLENAVLEAEETVEDLTVVREERSSYIPGQGVELHEFLDELKRARGVSS